MPLGNRLAAAAFGFALSTFFAGTTTTAAEPTTRPADAVKPAEMAGYLLVSVDKVPETYNAGFSVYVAAWPLVDPYPGHRFQTGLFGTWMHPQYDGPPPAKLYTDVEGGLGWWRDTRFPTTTPKFIMGGVAPNFSEIANGPAHGAGTWDKPRGLYGVAQLSPRLLFPIDGLNVKQGASGDLFGYGYLTLPLIPAKPTTAGKPVPTGGNAWTLFLNTGNFKGPVAFFTPYFWSRAAAADPTLAGLLLDSRPANPNKAIQMETQYVPAATATDAKGVTYAKVAATSFPRGPAGDSVLVHGLTAYDKRAMWDGVAAWLDGGGPPVAGAINPAGAVAHRFPGKGGATWKIYDAKTPKEQRPPIAWASVGTPSPAVGPDSYGLRWGDLVTAPAGAKSAPLATLPQYYRLEEVGKARKPQWVAVKPQDVPPETGLAAYKFERPREQPQKPYVTPEEPTSNWKTPGPKAGPFKARLGDGSVVTYYWYRFADQPALLNADLTPAERERLQARVEKLHRAWTIDKDYLAPPKVGKLADLDPAQLVTPPAGLEVGYVPIGTRQELAP
ncbi:MAG TPA: hypothetical protein VF796_28925 [Humisphaera sp.]